MRELEILIKHLERELEILSSFPESKLHEHLRSQIKTCQEALDVLIENYVLMQEGGLL